MFVLSAEDAKKREVNIFFATLRVLRGGKNQTLASSARIAAMMLL
jgi:hypothetical protein